MLIPAVASACLSEWEIARRAELKLQLKIGICHSTNLSPTEDTGALRSTVTVQDQWLQSSMKSHKLYVPSESPWAQPAR